MNTQNWIRSLTILCACAFALPAQDARAQETFATPDKAVESLVAAGKTGDSAGVLAILGKEARDIVSSGDSAFDQNMREDFINAYEEKHAIEIEGNKAVLSIGAEDWPFAIPLVKKGKGWQFDVAAGKQELLFRRIGRNELSVIQVCQGYVDAQHDYAAMMKKQSGSEIYAQYLVSHTGKKDGLYWPKDGADESPLGDFVAKAAAEGYEKKGEARTPYHGYYYKILTRQGAGAEGGARNYVEGKNMTGGFALVAWPAIYQNSGVMTFIVNQEGVIYQKDLGPDTVKLASQMSAFNPDKTWQQALPAQDGAQ